MSRVNKSVALPQEKWDLLINLADLEGHSNKNRYIEYLFDNREAIKEVEELKQQLNDERKKIADWIMSGAVASAPAVKPVIEKKKTSAMSQAIKNTLL